MGCGEMLARDQIGKEMGFVRLGGPILEKYNSAAQWVELVKDHGYGAAYCPIGTDADDAVVNEYCQAADQAGIVIAEVGAWSNPLDSRSEERQKAIAHCCAQLDLADRIGARCCVNIAGSRGAKWDGPHPQNLTEETFQMIVDTTRQIIDTVQPTRTFYTLEPMPWIFPDSPDSYLALIRAIDRSQFAVHLDPVNMINCPQRYFHGADFLQECFRKLGPWIRSCHVKDIVLSDQLTVHLNEVRPGLGGLDLGVFLREAHKLDSDLPVLVEHLSTAAEYDQAVSHLRQIAAANNLDFVTA